jgi:ribosomal protein S18 acetylase RimI-like enzyme
VTPPRARLRPLTDEEYDAFRVRNVPLYAEDVERSRGLKPAAALAVSEETFPRTLAEAAAPDRTWILRALDDGGVPVGWLWLGPHPAREDGVFVYDVEIAEAFQGRGLGRATMLAAEELAREAGLNYIQLNVFGWNSRAAALYQSLGYVTLATQMGKPLQDPS